MEFLFSEWARRHGVSEQAVADLKATLLRELDCETKPTSTTSGLESPVNGWVRQEAAEKGGRLFRNNVGSALNAKGVPVRFGLANDSKAVNERIKSSDLVGIRPVKIEPRHVGMTFGLFVARECKRPGWVFKGTPRENAQLKWLCLIAILGGDAAFATGKGTL